MKRRTALIAFTSTAVLASLTACMPGTGSGSAAGAPTELVITTFGGDWQKNFTDAVVKPFEKANNVTIKQVTLYSADALAQLQAQKSSPQIDVVFFSGGQEATAARDKLIAPISASSLSNGADLIDSAKSGLEQGEGPVIQISPVGLTYRTDKIDKPTSWNDVFDPKYKKHVAFTDLSNSYGTLGMLSINQAKGGTADDVTPGISAMGQAAKAGDAVVIKTSSDLQQAFSSRDIWLAPYAQDYAETLRKAGQPVEFVLPAEGSMASFITANAVAGRANIPLATKFIDFALSSDVQAKFVSGMTYSSVNQKTEIPEDLKSKVVWGSSLDKLQRLSGATFGEKSATWLKQWNEAIAQ
ncbi:ABC transporter substrate-binding protein [Arthrobacter sp. 35W]|uniref:ABC transporter substrate-binding protein n=1 Tax=Arthrobacter sp. 35W TaxID=1132441 RepID=UPI0004231117|nr:ABC transporter substrate-binding protein [Arthrobacter sp. 35W]